VSAERPQTAGESSAGDFTWIDGERLIRFSDRALDEAPALLRERGFDGYSLVTTARAGGLAPELRAGARVVVEVPPGPVPEAAAAIGEELATTTPLVALGGGRAIDSAKAIAAVRGLACAAIPTTLSGAEMTPFHRLPAGAEGAATIRPALVLAQPALMASQPMPELAASAMNALAHAVEALYVRHANPVAELAALRAARLIGEGLTADPPTRSGLALGAILAGYAIGVTGLALHHVVSQSIVRVAGTAHAATNAVVLPRVVAAMEPRAPRALGRLAVALGATSEDPAAASELVGALTARAEVARLSELGVGEELVEPIAAEAAARPQLANIPDPPSERELAALVGEAL
jgi:alcohol dehydrogenase class IV